MPDTFGGRIAVPDELDSAGPAIMAIATAIEAELAALKNQLMPLRSSWVGQANQSWEDLQNIWDTAAANLMTGVGALGSISNAVKISSVNYHSTENTNTRIFQSGQ